ncbi:futalosine hydrolase [Ammoniphilus sp. CFH 90114]|uniref:futalosine hydrolase n=1 Tax=Ammoniphilus sp. CFH 90114 TaxID=2493665 RepID=UPI00100F4582|nr:futalosine hydrolase [Ammoniphilus sp. CFH 90114]RXT08016.1 futalosine hydrolase [Ammoniphilus sp. CFH 90114]
MNSDVVVETRKTNRTLVMTAVSAEREAVMRGLQGNESFDVELAGVGPIAAAANTARLLARKSYDLVISAGIGGGFPKEIEDGGLVVSKEIIGADLGAQTPEGFLSLDELGFGFTRVPIDESLAVRVIEALNRAGLPAKLGPVLTVSTATGTAETAMELAKRVPGAVAEAMEGFGVATAAQMYSIPVLEIRTISNQVGPRDRAAWRIKEALQTLESASSVLSEVFT